MDVDQIATPSHAEQQDLGGKVTPSSNVEGEDATMGEVQDEQEAETSMTAAASTSSSGRGGKAKGGRGGGAAAATASGRGGRGGKAAATARGGSKAGKSGAAAGKGKTTKDGTLTGAGSAALPGPTFPLARVSRIVKADRDVETTSKDAIWTIAVATVGIRPPDLHSRR